MEVISIHSNKGGSGKTTLAIGLAVLFAEEGKQVCIVETDLSGAGLYGNLKLESKSNYFNQYLLENGIGVESLLRRYTDGNINFWAIICDPDIDKRDEALALAEQIRQDGENKMRNRFLNLVGKLQKLKKPTSFDYCIFDCSAGVDGISLLSLGITLRWNGIPVFISTPDRPQIGGMVRELMAFYRENILDPARAIILVNRVSEKELNLYGDSDKLKNAIIEDGILGATEKRFTKVMSIPLYDFILEDPKLGNQFLLTSTGEISLKAVKNTNISRIAKQIQNELSKRDTESGRKRTTQRVEEKIDNHWFVQLLRRF